MGLFACSFWQHWRYCTARGSSPAGLCGARTPGPRRRRYSPRTHLPVVAAGGPPAARGPGRCQQAAIAAVAGIGSGAGQVPVVHRDAERLLEDKHAIVSTGCQARRAAPDQGESGHGILLPPLLLRTVPISRLQSCEMVWHIATTALLRASRERRAWRISTLRCTGRSGWNRGRAPRA